MMQGDSYLIPVEISTESGVADENAFLDVEIQIGDMRKVMSAGDITYDKSEKAFMVKMTQEESFDFQFGPVPIQVRVKTMNGNVIGASGGDIDVLQSISKAVL